MPLAMGGEKVLEQLRRFIGAHASYDFWLMEQPTVAHNIKDGTDSTSAWLVRTKNETR